MSALQIRVKNNQRNNWIKLLQQGRQLKRQLENQENRYIISGNSQKYWQQKKQEFVNKLILYIKANENSNKLSIYMYLLKAINAPTYNIMSLTARYSYVDRQCDLKKYKADMPDLSCVGCSSHFVKKIILNSEFNDFTPFVVVLESELKTPLLSKIFCSLLNYGGGIVLIALQKIEDTHLLIQSGFPSRIKQINQQLIKLQTKLYKACNESLQIIYYAQKEQNYKVQFHKEKKPKHSLQAINNIHLQIEFVPLKQNLSEESNQKQFIIRITICQIIRSKQIPLFYILNQKQGKPHICILKLIQTHNKFRKFIYQILESQHIYQYIIINYFRKRKLIQCKCLNPTYQKVQEIKNLIKKIIQPQKNLIKPQKKQYYPQISFSFTVKQYFACEDHLKNLEQYGAILSKQFNKYRSNFNPQTYILVEYKNISKMQVYRSGIIKLFEEGKIQFKNFSPILQYQQFLFKLKKNNQGNQSLSYYQLFIFQGRYDQFMAKLKTVFGYQYSQFFSAHLILPKIQLGNSVSKKDFQYFQNFITKQCNEKLAINKDIQQLGSYKRIKIQFNKKLIPFATLTFLIMLICKKRPKCQ